MDRISCFTVMFGGKTGGLSVAGDFVGLGESQLHESIDTYACLHFEMKAEGYCECVARHSVLKDIRMRM